MKLYAIFLITLLAGSAIAEAPSDQLVLNAVNSELLKIKDQRFSSIVSTLIEMGVGESSFDDLFEALDDLLASISDTRSLEAQAFSDAQTLHNKMVTNLAESLDDAKTDVAGAESVLNSRLVPEQTRLTNSIANNQQQIEDLEDKLESLPKQREAQHNQYLQRAKDLSDLIQAIDEVIGMIQELRNPSLVEVKSKEFTGKLSKIEEGIKPLNNEYAPLLHTLAQICSDQNFADQEALASVTSLLNDIRHNIQQHEQLEEEQDDQAEDEFQDQLENTKEALALYQQSLSGDQEALTRINGEITVQKGIVESRGKDADTYGANLEKENYLFDNVTRLNQETHNDLDDAEKTIKQCIDLLNSRGIQRSQQNWADSDDYINEVNTRYKGGREREELIKITKERERERSL
eukprot:TRINITY_DN1564_c0_g4_i3.p2 TRINITY_DN1564_c0_g4~~TRINITY_DN1564_c0_g4_i3.p2  ORF type:complete len:405 (+),score=197.81 TRINITY_DN1564_c0_g4_i3:103-1317(+)